MNIKRPSKFFVVAYATIVLLTNVLGPVLTPAQAQFAPTPSQSRTYSTYRASVVALAPAASATDFLTVSGSASKTVAVTRLECNGIATTAATPDVVVIRRSTANLTGTSTSPTATPLDSNNAAATAVVRAYTVNPGTLGTLVGALGAAKLPLPLAATGADLSRTQFVGTQFGPSQPVTLRGVAQSVGLNGNAATLGTGAVLDCTIEWLEF